jgi:uncharacterized protein
MRVDVADIKLEAGAHKVVPVTVAADAVDMAGEEAKFDRPFEGEAEIWNAGDRLLVKASLSGEALVQCSRCLKEFSVPLEIEFEEEFIEGSPEQADEDDDEEIEGGQRTVTYYSGDEIDLSEPLRENVLLEIPMKPLCTEDCKGLCPSCGTNLNEGSCECTGSNTTVDPRFAALQQLLRKPDSNS